MRLNQVIAVESGAKTKAEKVLTDAYQMLQKKEPLSGISRNYKPKDDDGEGLPPESTRVQIRTTEVIEEVQLALAELFNTVATKEWGNTEAKADVKIGDTVLLSQVPVTVLLFIEKQLVNIKTFISKLPVLDAGEDWVWDSSQNCFATRPYETVRTKKVPQRFVKAEATDKHAAQVDVFHEDVPVGRWTTVKYSGAMKAQDVASMLKRVEGLRDAVKQARQEANMTQVQKHEIAKQVLAYVFSGDLSDA